MQGSLLAPVRARRPIPGVGVLRFSSSADEIGE
jgi:hypothetical protein